MRIYLDSCIVIYYIERHMNFFQKIDARFLDDGNQWLTSDLCRLECQVQPVRQQDEQRLTLYRKFFASTDLSIIPFTHRVFDLAIDLRAQHNLKTPDALHLAAAIVGGCQEFWTQDHRLDHAAAHYLRTTTLQ